MTKKLIDWEDLKNEDMPLIVFSAHSWDIFSYLIRWRTRSAHNHVMWMVDTKTFASQNISGYRKVSWLAYNKPGSRLKFVKVKNLTAVLKLLIYQSIDDKLKQPWYRKMYDFLGILGQLVGIRRMQSPWNDFCVEDTIRHLLPVVNHVAETEYMDIDFIKLMDDINPSIPPEAFNRIIKAYPQFFECVGYWQYD